MEDRPVFTDAEYRQAHLAYEEYMTNCGAKLACLRCGSSFLFFGVSVGLELRCELTAASWSEFAVFN
jgi:hypothetical protein